MVLLFRLITRLIVIAIGYVFACVAAISFLTASVLLWRHEHGGLGQGNVEEDIFVYTFHAAFGLISFGHISAAAVTPVVAIVLLTEAFSLKNWLYQTGLGGVVALILLFGSDVYVDALPPQQDIILSLAAGFAGGFIYWLIAGRGAGNWRSKRTVASPSLSQE